MPEEGLLKTAETLSKLSLRALLETDQYYHSAAECTLIDAIWRASSAEIVTFNQQREREVEKLACDAWSIFEKSLVSNPARLQLISSRTRLTVFLADNLTALESRWFTRKYSTLLFASRIARKQIIFEHIR